MSSQFYVPACFAYIGKGPPHYPYKEGSLRDIMDFVVYKVSYTLVNTLPTHALFIETLIV
jgi:hypothetical protein